MGSTFGGIEHAAGAIDAARYGLEVVSQNIANADTPGYTRQASAQSAVDGSTTVPSVHTRPTGPAGVTVTGTSRQADPVLDARARVEHARTALADTTAAQLSAVEDVFNEPSDSGLAAQLNTFWNAWATVANQPASGAARGVLLQDATSVANTLNSMSTSLDDFAENTAMQLGRSVQTANSAATQLATLNGQIAVARATGADANALLDQRDQLRDQLGTLVGATSTIGADGAASVTVGGQTLVTGTTASALSLTGSQVAVGGTAVTLTGGSAAAEVTALNTTVPAYQSRLNAVANALTSKVNAAQAAGYDASGAAGAPMFSGTGAGTIAVVLTDPADVAAAGTPGGNLDGSNALAISAFGGDDDGPDAAYAALVGDVGSASALASARRDTQDAISHGVDTLRESTSGVSYDEEVSSMLTYQHAYSAAARVLTTLDGMLDTLINHTGLVGRA
jgi:flagellar hook-associated protein 1 FlgK